MVFNHRGVEGPCGVAHHNVRCVKLGVQGQFAVSSGKEDKCGVDLSALFGQFAVVPVQDGAYLVISHVGVYAQVNGVSFHHSLQFQR